LQYLKLATVADAQFRHSPDPVRLALDVFDNGAVAWSEQFQGQKRVTHAAKPVVLRRVCY